jgi:hypothetical protein
VCVYVYLCTCMPNICIYKEIYFKELDHPIWGLANYNYGVGLKAEKSDRISML